MLKIFLFCFWLSFLPACGGGSDSLPQVPEVKKPVLSFLGTNYAVSSWGTERDLEKEALGFEPGWYYPALNLRMVIGSLDTNRSQVQKQLETLKAAGANAISFPIWYEELGQEHPENQEIYAAYSDKRNDGVWGNTIDSTGAKLQQQQIENLKWALAKSFSLGFSRVYIRFVQNNNISFTKDEQQFLKSVAVRLQIREIAREAYFQFYGVKPTDQLQFDLGGEDLTMANVNSPEMRNFLQRFWKIWIELPGGKLDNIGFSMIGVKSENYRFLWDSVYLPSGVFPTTVAVDIYASLDAASPDQFKSLEEAMVDVAAKLGTDRQVEILETYWNNQEGAESLKRFAASPLGQVLKLKTLLTWQIVQNSPTNHFSREGALRHLDVGNSPFIFTKSLLFP